MENDGISVLLVYSKQWKAEAIHYVSNYRMLGASAIFVMPIEGDPALFVAEPGDVVRAGCEGWVADVRPFQPENPAEAIELAASVPGKIGVAGLEIMGTPVYRLLCEKAGARVVNALSLLDDAAKIKSEWELQHLKLGGQLADLGFMAELAAARPGIKEYELAAEMNSAMLAAGADDNFQMFSAGTSLDCMHVPRDNAVQHGDLILAEITPYVGSFNYAAQLCRTVKTGRATSLEKEKYGILVTALEEALAMIRPGLQIKEIALKQNAIISAAGYEKYCHPPYMRSRGHNFGLGQFELTDDNEEYLCPGMAMVVHPNQLIPEIGYLACGETIYITENGICRVNKMPAKLYETETNYMKSSENHQKSKEI
jgi:Xaa-Pro aminopeptidase